jgi:TolB-like protein
MKTVVRTLIGLMALALMAGCASNMVARKRTDQPIPAQPRIAVLPFENLSGRENAGDVVTDYFQSAMAADARFVTVELGETYDVLRRHRIRSSWLLTGEQISTLGKELNIDYILTGSILEYDEYENSYLGRVPQVSFNTRLVDCKSGETIWTAVSNGRGDRGEVAFGIGTITSAEVLAREMVTSAMNNIAGHVKH